MQCHSPNHEREREKERERRVILLRRCCVVATVGSTNVQHVIFYGVRDALDFHHNS